MGVSITLDGTTVDSGINNFEYTMKKTQSIIVIVIIILTIQDLMLNTLKITLDSS